MQDGPSRVEILHQSSWEIDVDEWDEPTLQEVLEAFRDKAVIALYFGALGILLCAIGMCYYDTPKYSRNLMILPEFFRFALFFSLLATLVGTVLHGLLWISEWREEKAK